MRPEPAEKIDLMRTREIMDIKVQNPDGENLGDLTDIAIDRDNGCIVYAMLAHGGIFGFGEKYFAIPWEGVRIRSREKIAVVDTDKEILDKSHGFSRDQMPLEGDWNLIRTPPPPTAGREHPPPPREKTTVVREEKPPAPAESGPRREESYTPVPPAVQTVAGGWGGQPTKERAEGSRPTGAVEEIQREEPVRTEAQATGAVEEIRREEPVRTEAQATGAVEEIRREEPARTEAGRARPSAAHISAADLQVYLRGIDYPAGRQDLVAHAQKNNAPESVITILGGFSDRTYRSAAEVSQEFGRETRGERRETTVEERPETGRARPSAAHISAADLQVYLRGIDYPAGRQDLVAHAQKNNAPESVITILGGFSDRTYRSAAEVSQEFGKVR